MRDELMEKRPREIRGMFARIAHRYDLLNHLLSLGQDVLWRRRLATVVRRNGLCPVLDVCCGTGDVALALGPGAAAVGTDFCLPMLTRAAAKARSRGLRLPLFAADALRLPLPDGCVAAVTVAFGVRNFHDLQAGLGELVRVVRPGGSVLILEFSHPSGPVGRAAAAWSAVVPPLVGRIVSGDPEAYRYLPASVERFPDTGEMCGILQRHGLERVTGTRFSGGVATLYQGWKPSEEAS